jgi:hypothetical protein
MTSQEISAYKLDKNDSLQKNSTNCETPNCRDILVSDWEEVCDDVEINFYGDDDFNVSVSAWILNFNKNYSEIFSQEILDRDDGIAGGYVKIALSKLD